jgi:hypothetical protein
MKSTGTMNDFLSSRADSTVLWVRHTVFIVAALLIQSSCAPKGPPPVYHITHIIPAGSRIEYYAQLPDETWKLTQKVHPIPRPMLVKEAEKWAISSARARLGDKWKDYSIRVVPPDNHSPVVVWRRADVQQF